VSAATVPAPATLDALIGMTALTILLIVAALSDLRHRRIGNRLCLTIALLAVPYWLVTEPTHPFRLPIQIGLALIVGLVALLPFLANLLGGGDVKLIAALALWLPPASLVNALLVTAIAGGVLGLAMLLLARRWAEKSVPYGVAIAIAGIAAVAPRMIELLR
jgi:prepilin peptidase CpaA